MFTDHCKEIGAKSLWDAFKIKEKMMNDFYSMKYDKYATNRIDTSIKYNFLICNRKISLDPNKDRFIDSINYDERTIPSFVDEIVYDVFNQYDNEHNYKTSSKNETSLRMFLTKLFKKGSINEVLNALSKIGILDDFNSNWGFSFENKELDYWDAIDYNVVGAKGEYVQKREESRRAIEKWIREKQANNG